MAACQQCLAPLKPSVPILFAGSGSSGGAATEAYRRWCGDDAYVAWCGGTMLVVPNSHHLGRLLPTDSAPGIPDPPRSPSPPQGGALGGGRGPSPERLRAVLPPIRGRSQASWLCGELARGECCAARVFLVSPVPFHRHSNADARHFNADYAVVTPSSRCVQTPWFVPTIEERETLMRRAAGGEAAGLQPPPSKQRGPRRRSPEGVEEEQTRVEASRREAERAAESQRRPPRMVALEGIFIEHPVVEQAMTGSGSGSARRRGLPPSAGIAVGWIS